MHIKIILQVLDTSKDATAHKVTVNILNGLTTPKSMVYSVIKTSKYFLLTENGPLL